MHSQEFPWCRWFNTWSSRFLQRNIRTPKESIKENYELGYHKLGYHELGNHDTVYIPRYYVQYVNILFCFIRYLIWKMIIFWNILSSLWRWSSAFACSKVQYVQDLPDGQSSENGRTGARAGAVIGWYNGKVSTWQSSVLTLQLASL